MLLIDRIIETGARTLAGVDPDSGFYKAWSTQLSAFKAAIVFDVTNAIAALNDIVNACSRGKMSSDFNAPCLLPGSVTWIEAETTAADSADTVRYGSMIADVSELGVGVWMANGDKVTAGENRIYFMKNYCQMGSRVVEDFSFHNLVELKADGTSPLIKTNGKGDNLRGHFHLSKPTEHGIEWMTPTTIDGLRMSTFGLPGVFEDFSERDIDLEIETTPWLTFSALALLGCRNVATEEHVVDPRKARRLAKQNRPPRVTYKTLHLIVPSHLEKHAGGDGTGPKQRMHWCRGHFKNLQHPRYKEVRGLHWWPGHWRGDVNLGRVEKRYSVESKSENDQT